MYDVRSILQLEPSEALAKRLGYLHIHLVVHQQQGHFCGTHGPFGEFDAIELIHFYFDGIAYFGELLAVVKLTEEVELKPAQFTVRQHKKFSTATGRDEKV